MQQGEALQIAEIFAGGFGVWSRAVASWREAGVRAHISWQLERDPACFPALHAADPHLQEISSPTDIPPDHHPVQTVLLPVDFRDQWWKRIFHLRPVQIVCVCPQCQPWSTEERWTSISGQGNLTGVG